MNRQKRFLVATVGTFVFTLCGFVVMGVTRGFVGYHTARLLAAPFVTVGVACAVYAFALSVLVTAGVLDLDPAEE
ncbi:hypothetical protein [Halocalculus aciditolerans]|uniref:Uncharacterized protein n=1 Tax=Halocalculus aciditolerans TaxID=1383812 RepID=A0A830FFN0_9EURY|nr:hypothetical protein [Halocalculus aciditolerans]GGL70804.1 hypothetical protein GCM10009039_31100 [Halocalculus aciditolerans]